MKDRSIQNRQCRRRRALALTALLSFSLAVPTALFGVAHAALPGAAPSTVIAGGSLHSCALFYDGTLRCWGSNALEQIGAGMNVGPSFWSTEDQPPPVAPAYGACADNLDCACGQYECPWAGDVGRCSTTAHQCGCAWACPSGMTCGSSGFCQECSTDADCPTGNTCTHSTLAGYTVNLCTTSTSGACSSDADCGTGKCVPTANWSYALDAGASYCVQCLQDSDCGSGGFCSNYQCVCSGASYCPTGSACSMGTCQPSVPDGGTCGSCPWGYTCGGSGACVPASEQAIPEVPEAGLPDGGGGDAGAPLIGNVIALAAGDAHTCALVAGGNVWCWGEGSAGQLGSGSFNPSSLPVQVAGIGESADGGTNPPAIAIAAGANHTCAVLANGTLACWGDNSQFQSQPQADGGAPPPRSNTPLPVQGLSGVVAVAAGADHTCALLADGTVSCWGDNSNGQAGASSGAVVTTPATVGGLSGVTATAIAAGRLHNCVLGVSAGGTQVYCWGYNGNGQLGNGGTTDSSSAVSVSGISKVRSISAGGDHACALLASGTVWCWGDNGHGETGDGNPGNADTSQPDASNVITSTAKQVSGLSGVRAISSGYFHNCAVLDDGTVKCWGGNVYGQLGINARSISGGGAPSATANFGSTAPNLVSNGPQIALGMFHACVLGADGSAKCWGGSIGQPLGGGSSSWSAVPVDAGVLPVGADGDRGALGMCAGVNFTCSVLSDGTVWCWGDDTYAELGDGGTSSTPEASPVMIPLPSTTPALQITCGEFFACALLSDGTVQCWGDAANGALGNGQSTGFYAPQTVETAVSTSLTDVSLVASGPQSGHACAIQGGGTVYCWGYASSGQVGPNNDSSTYPAQTYAVQVPLGGTGATAVAKSLGLGSLDSCAVGADGTAQCWGYGYHGELGNGTTTASSTPVSVVSSGFHWLTSIAGGADTTCALGGDGSAWCWGYQSNGSLGNDNTTSDSDVPTNVVVYGGGMSYPALGGGVCIAAGYLDGCALRADGTVYCWGYGGWGEIGDGSTSDSAYATPVSYPPLTQ